MLTEHANTADAAIPFRIICMPENGKIRGGTPPAMELTR